MISVDHVSEVPAGRNTDLLVEEIVMGTDLDDVARNEFISYRNHNAGIGMTGWEEYDPRQYRDRMLAIAVPHYSTSIAAALKILRKVGYWYWKAETDLSDDGSVMWHFRVGEPPNHRWFSAHAPKDQEPLAICRASLIAARSSDAK